MSIRIPKYRCHKGSGQALVQINGDRICLGKYDSEEGKEKYQRLVSERLSNGRQRVSLPTADSQASADLSIKRLILAYWRFAESYCSKVGKPTKELTCMREAIRPLRQLYGNTRASEFGPKALKAVRRHPGNAAGTGQQCSGRDGRKRGNLGVQRDQVFGGRLGTDSGSQEPHWAGF